MLNKISFYSIIIEVAKYLHCLLEYSIMMSEIVYNVKDCVTEHKSNIGSPEQRSEIQSLRLIKVNLTFKWFQYSVPCSE